MKKLFVLGCTGSIGSQTLDIARNMRDDFTVVGITAGHRRDELEKLCAEFGCPGSLYEDEGIEGIRKLAESCGADIAVNGIAGAAGLEPSAIALEAGMDLALANKETVVMAWPLIQALAKKTGRSIIPVDSEHSAVFNLIQQSGKNNVAEIIITASGGPFREYTDEQLKSVTVEQALHHPTWNMGPKITIDSATLANKGLEVIEACRLFDMPTERVKVVVHPQSLIHSLVRTRDGMLYAQISNPDMRHPILGALTWPENRENYLEKFDLAGHTMTFFPPRLDSFPMLRLAYFCAKAGKSYTIAFNAANEVAVAAFIAKKCAFMDIPRIVAGCLEADWSAEPESLAEVFETDQKARNKADELFVKISGGCI